MQSPSTPVRTVLTLLLFAVAASSACAAARAQAQLHSVPAFPLRTAGPVITQRVAAGEPFTVAGPQGVLVGQQQGLLEAWLLPVKLLSHLTLEAQVQGYSVPLDLNSMAREIEVRPDRTTITYSHIAVTVRQIMFAPQNSSTGTGVVILFQVDSVRPVTLTLRFTGEMREMWPKPSSGNPSAEWVPANPAATSGFYILHTDYPSLAGAVALPGATPGILAPYQERPQVYPLELHLHIDPIDPIDPTDPAKDNARFYPLLLAMGRTSHTASNTALAASLQQLNDSLPQLYADHAALYRQQQSELTSILTPDAALNADLAWAETSISQLRARTHPLDASPPELGLVAGYYASGDSARPGFGWYFGRDTLYTLYAVNSYGDFALSRSALAFLIRRQRADGKVMHEFSQTAAELDWAAFPYQYAAADATPLFLTTMLDYVRSSGDLDFLRSHRESVMNAWRFETGLTAKTDADGDGIYDNSQGTGWVESWVPSMPQQEIYLALFDQQASSAMAQLAHLLGDDATATAAQQRATRLHATIEREYYRPSTGTYAFSFNSGTADDTATIYPAVAWWNTPPQNQPSDNSNLKTDNSNPTTAPSPLDHPAASLRSWASHDFDTDWGLRDVSETALIYDPISYHQGSVWPLFTGWAALAQYRSGHPLAGYQALMQNAGLTTAQDPGAVTELLSGAFFEPFGRSTSHQLWSSAMVATPLLRGLFGITADGLAHTLTVTPHLPADWPSADIHHLHVGDSIVDLHYQRSQSKARSESKSGQQAATLSITLHHISGPPVRLIGVIGDTLRLPLPSVELILPHGLPLRGSRTSQLKVLAETAGPHSLHLELEAPAGSDATLHLQQNLPTPGLHAEGATLGGDELHITFPPGTGYTTQTVTVRW